MKNFTSAKVFGVVLSVFLFNRGTSQINITPNATLTQLVNSLAGSGAIITNPQLVCPNGAYGTFTNGSSTNLGINSGVLLTTGSASAVNGPSSGFASVDNAGGGNALLNSIAGATTFEECRLEFDIMPTCASLQMSYVFGSEEYPEWVNQGFNDAFGFFISGPNPGGGSYSNLNIATVPSTTLPVTIDNINSTTNAAYYVDNTLGTTIVYDGMTTPLTATVSVTPCSTYHMILVIADGGDGVYDSGVFLTYQGLTCPAPTVTASGAATICPGQSATLSASGMTGYTWQPGGQTTSSITVSPSVTTTYTVTGTSGVCNIDTATVTVTVSAPAATASNAGPYCDGETINLNSSGGGTYSWSGPSGFSSSLQNPSISPAASSNSGVYTVTVTAGGCTTTATTSVSVSPPPSPTASNTGAYCEGATISLSSSGGGIYNWSGPGGFSSSSQNPSIAGSTTSMSGLYTVTVSIGSCTSTASTSVTVNPSPVPTASNTGPYCDGQTIDLSSSGGGTYNWSGPSGFSSSSQNPSVISATSVNSGVYTVTVTLGSCTSTATTSVTVSPPPSPSASNTGAYCEGQIISLSASGGITYNWSGPGGFSSSSQNPSIGGSTTSMSGVYDVTVSVGSCTSTASTTVTVNANPVSTASNTGPYCDGANVNLSSSGGGTYNWSGPGGFSDATQNPSLSGATSANSGVYTVTVTVGSCTSTASTTVTVNANPSPTLSSNAPVCDGGTVNLSCGNGVSWSWSGPNGFTSALQNPVISPATPSESGTYSVSIIDANGCSGIATLSVVVNTLPTVSASAAGSICQGDTTQLIAVGASSYTWSAGTNPSAGSTVDASPASTSTYTVTGTDGNGCSSTASVTVNVNALPVVSVASSTICQGMSDTLVATGAVTYSWSAGTTSVSSSNDSVVVSPSSTSSYTVTGTDANGCSDTAVTTVTLNGTGLPVTAGSSDTLCSGMSATLTAGGAINYTWMPGSMSGTSITVTPGSTTTYTVTGTDGSGCSGTDSVVVNVAQAMSNTPASANISCNAACNGSASVSITPSTGPFANYTYQWSNGSVNDSISNLCPGTYSVTVTDGAGCTLTDSITITEPSALSANATAVNILCNGGTGSASVSVSGGTASYSYSWSPSGGSSSTATALPANTYTVSISDANSCTTSVQVTITQPTALSASATASSINCSTPTGSISSSVAGGTPPYSYNWAPAGTGVNPTGLAAGSYTLTVTDSNNCVTTQTVSITSNTTPPGVNAGTDDTLDCGATASLNLSGSSATGGVTYSWSGPSGFSSSSQTPSITTPGTYTLMVTNPANGCTSVDSVNIGQSFIDASFTANPPSGIFPLPVGFTNTSTNAGSYIWDFGNGTGSTGVNDSSVYLANGTYTVTLYAFNSFNCIDSATAIITVGDPTTILVPNVFTPNGDGINDIFFITSTGLSTLEVNIFDRWGLKVGEITSLTGGWNGKTKGGNESADGTYYYLLKATGADGKDYSVEGYLLLSR